MNDCSFAAEVAEEVERDVAASSDGEDEEKYGADFGAEGEEGQQSTCQISKVPDEETERDEGGWLE